MQICVDRQLWPLQKVIMQDRRYCLAHLGFGLNKAPMVLKAVIKIILGQDPEAERTVLPYVDDLLMDEDQVSAEKVSTHFASFRLECKQPNHAVDGTRLQGLHVQLAGGQQL